MKFLVKNLPFEGTGEWQNLKIGDLNLSVQWPPGWVTDTGRKIGLVRSDMPMGGYIGISKGPDRYHIGSPGKNTRLATAARVCGWTRI